jgi:hypothetical protein
MTDLRHDRSVPHAREVIPLFSSAIGNCFIW